MHLEISDINRRFIKQMAWPAILSEVMDLMDDVYFWLKDPQGRFMVVNDKFQNMCNRGSGEPIIGKTDYDIWPEHLADEYVADDRVVLETRKPLPGKRELIVKEDGSATWFKTTKFPLLDNKNNIIGIGGFTRDLRTTYSEINPLMKFIPVIDHIRKNLNEDIKIEDLARIMDVTPDTLDKMFHKYFHLSPNQYVAKMRSGGADRRKTETKDSVAL